MVRPDEPELGPQRFCRRCAEWWPFTAEFWQAIRGGTTWACRACVREWNRAWYTRAVTRSRQALRAGWRVAAARRRGAAA